MANEMCLENCRNEIMVYQKFVYPVIHLIFQFDKNRLGFVLVVYITITVLLVGLQFIFKNFNCCRMHWIVFRREPSKDHCILE